MLESKPDAFLVFGSGQNNDLSTVEDRLEIGTQLFKRMLNHPDWNFGPYPVFSGADNVHTLWDWLLGRVRLMRKRHGAVLDDLELGQYHERDQSEGSRELTGYTEYSLIERTNYSNAWSEMKIVPLQWLREWQQRQTSPEAQVQQEIVALIVGMSDKFLGCAALEPYFEEMSLDFLKERQEEEIQEHEALEAKWLETKTTLVHILDEDADEGKKSKAQKDYEESRDLLLSRISDIDEVLFCYKQKQGEAVVFHKWFNKVTFAKNNQHGHAVRNYEKCGRRLTKLLKQLPPFDARITEQLVTLATAILTLEQHAAKPEGGYFSMIDFIRDSDPMDDYEGLSPECTMGFWYSFSDRLSEEMCDSVDSHWNSSGLNEPVFTLDFLDPQHRVDNLNAVPSFPMGLRKFMDTCDTTFRRLCDILNLDYS